MSHHQHHKVAQTVCCCYVVTVSDTRTEAYDRSGQYLLQVLREKGHTLAGYSLLKDEPTQIRQLLAELAECQDIEVVLLSGGTGISRRDRTYEAVVQLLEKQLDGFGEIFRSLSFREIGSSAMLSRAIAGIWAGKALFAMPGSLAAVRLAMEQLILPEMGHIVSELKK